MLRNPIFCLSNQFLSNWCCAPPMVQFANVQTFFLEKNFECKATFNFFFNICGFFMPFWWEWQLALYILSDFPGIKNLNGLIDLNSLNNLSGLNDLYSLISSKNLLFKEKYIFFWWFVTFYCFKKAPKSQNKSKFMKE